MLVAMQPVLETGITVVVTEYKEFHLLKNSAEYILVMLLLLF